jgi:CTP synthase
METIYQVPVLLHDQGLLQRLSKGLGLEKLTLSPSTVAKGSSLWELWKKTIAVPKDSDPVNIALVGKYTQLMDSYISVIKALEHAAMRCKRKLNLIPVDSEHLEAATQQKDPAKYHKAWHQVCEADGLLVPGEKVSAARIMLYYAHTKDAGGFGQRGTEGMIACAKWARENKKNYLGICLGMQVATVEVSRALTGRPNATSEEWDDTSKDPNDWAVVFMPESSKEYASRLGLLQWNTDMGIGNWEAP